MDIKNVKGKDYLQIVDNRGYIHHIGPATLLNLAGCKKVIGFNEGIIKKNKRKEKFMNYFISKGYPRISENNALSANNLADAISVHYFEGFNGMVSSTSVCGESTEIDNIENDIIDRIELFELLEEWIRKHYEKRNETITNKDIRIITQSTYRHASTVQRAEWKSDLEQRRQRQIGRFIK